MSDVDKIKDDCVLILDDDDDVRSLIKVRLMLAGFENIFDTPSPPVALHRVRGREIKLVLLDWWMPKMDGLEVLNSVKSIDKNIPVIMLTQEDRKDMVVKAIQAGCDDYIVKPWEDGELTEKVTKTLIEASERRPQGNDDEEVV